MNRFLVWLTIILVMVETAYLAGAFASEPAPLPKLAAVPAPTPSPKPAPMPAPTLAPPASTPGKTPTPASPPVSSPTLRTALPSPTATATPAPGGGRTFGGKGDDVGYCVQQTADGGYIIAGDTASFGTGGGDAYLIKTDKEGRELWSRTFGGKDYDAGYSVQQTTDGGYIVAGLSKPYDAPWTVVYLVKTDENGKQLWSRTFGGNGDAVGHSVQQTADGGYIIAGYANSFGSRAADVYLIKTDKDGEELWSCIFGGNDDDRGFSVRQTTDGGYIIAGYTNSFGAGAADVYLIKTDKDGNELWNRTFGGTGTDEGYSVQQIADGGYIIAGYTNSYGAGAADVYLIKTDKDGNKVWSRTFGGKSFERGHSVQQTADGGYIIAGYTNSFGAGAADVYLIKTDKDGNELWSRTFGGKDDDEAYSVQQTADGGYIIAGDTNSYGAGGYDVYLIKTDAQGRSSP